MSWYDRLCDHVGDSLWRVAKQQTYWEATNGDPNK